jgi:hypothetical protein
MTPVKMDFRVEFDQVNTISLMRVEGRLTDESLNDLYKASRQYSSATDARVSIVDLSDVSEFAVSAQLIRYLAHQKPASPDARRRCFIVAPEAYAFGLCRMFQLLGEAARPLLQIVHTVGEAFAAIGIQPHAWSNLQSFRHQSEPDERGTITTELAGVAVQSAVVPQCDVIRSTTRST